MYMFVPDMNGKRKAEDDEDEEESAKKQKTDDGDEEEETPGERGAAEFSLRENFKTAAGQLSDRLKIFAGQKKNLSDRKNDQKKKLHKLVVFHE